MAGRRSVSRRARRRRPRRAGRDRDGARSHQGELLGALSVTKPPGEAADVRREQAPRRRRVAGRAGPSERPADRGAPRLAAAARRRPGRGAPQDRAQPPRRRAAAAGGADGASRACSRASSGGDPRRLAEMARQLQDRSVRGAGRPPRPGPRDLPAAARRQGPAAALEAQARKAPCRCRSRPTASGATRRRSRRPSTSARSRRCRTSRSTRSALERDGLARPSATDTSSFEVTDDGAGFDAGATGTAPGCRAWPTGSTRSAARWT